MTRKSFNLNHFLRPTFIEWLLYEDSLFKRIFLSLLFFKFVLLLLIYLSVSNSSDVMLYSSHHLLISLSTWLFSDFACIMAFSFNLL